MIKKDVGDINGEAECYGSLAGEYQSVDEHDNAIEHLKKSIDDQEKKMAPNEEYITVTI